jgi:hypothetical protein
VDGFNFGVKELISVHYCTHACIISGVNTLVLYSIYFIMPPCPLHINVKAPAAHRQGNEVADRSLIQRLCPVTKILRVIT